MLDPYHAMPCVSGIEWEKVGCVVGIAQVADVLLKNKSPEMFVITRVPPCANSLVATSLAEVNA